MNEPAVIPIREILGVRVHAATMQQALEACCAAIDARRTLTIGVVNAAKIVAMRGDAQLREAVASSDMVFADGMAVVWAGRLLGQPLPERIAGIDLFYELMRIGHERRYSAYFLGATREVLDEVVRRAGERFPNLRIAGARDGYFRPDEAAAVAADIARSRADMLFVAITSPKKELFMGAYGRDLGISVCHGVGGSFDVFAGKVRRAPRFWQRIGLEWLYRVMQEPGRLWRRYLVTNAQFLGMLARALLSGRRGAGSLGGEVR